MGTSAESTGMVVVVKGKNVDVVPALREQAIRKASKLGRYFNNHAAVRAEVALGFLRGQYTAEVTLQFGGVFLRGVGRSGEALGAVDEAVERAERQFLRFKSRFEPKSQPARQGEEAEAPEVAAQEPAEASEAGAPRVVRVKRFVMKPMAVDEAILQMEMLGHDFYVFRNAATDEMNVLYRRRDGNYGLIEPGE
ncbi:ribosome-associated translation inhibitor RaiA [Carboxydochorda subterranea]|uniref:Ribosome hibernation promoting factor n=1 Tax=Carboxydichorda subterranea TaxID=3109565 RepID=A0ABZ1BYS6_9FIRM|nr:ribosome-associated translation inhibitor RaiA [Limnochorda sp. L945t]WRP17995.1 ribosome-associated translation inhibitor RaiA [Limnochorda sp. L945t]